MWMVVSELGLKFSYSQVRVSCCTYSWTDHFLAMLKETHRSRQRLSHIIFGSYNGDTTSDRLEIEQQETKVKKKTLVMFRKIHINFLSIVIRSQNLRSWLW